MTFVFAGLFLSWFALGSGPTHSGSDGSDCCWRTGGSSEESPLSTTWCVPVGLRQDLWVSYQCSSICLSHPSKPDGPSKPVPGQDGGGMRVPHPRTGTAEGRDPLGGGEGCSASSSAQPHFFPRAQPPEQSRVVALCSGVFPRQTWRSAERWGFSFQKSSDAPQQSSGAALPGATAARSMGALPHAC